MQVLLNVDVLKMIDMKSIVIFFLVFLAVLSCNKPKTSENELVVQDFYWRGDSIGGSYYDHSSIIIPVEFERACTRKTFLQLQSGIRQNVIFDDFIHEFDSLSIEAEPQDSVYLSGEIGNFNFDAIPMELIHRQFQKNDSVVGNVGIDFFESKQLIIDFVQQTFSIVEDYPLPETCKPETYELYLDNKILVPVLLNGKRKLFLYNPQSPLYVAFNETKASELSFGGHVFSAPEIKSVENANPDFNGVLGYAFLKDKKVWIDTKSQQICIVP
jgi:hypothetical protein